MFGKTIPFAGIYARHARHLSLRDLCITTNREEFRPAIICDDVHDLSATDIRLMGAFSGTKAVCLRDVQNPTIVNCHSSHGMLGIRFLPEHGHRAGMSHC